MRSNVFDGHLKNVLKEMRVAKGYGLIGLFKESYRKYYNMGLSPTISANFANEDLRRC